MTEDHSELNLCPNCGKENLPMATRCVHCGSEMESLFTISGQSQGSDEDTEDSLPDIMEEIRNDPSLQTPAEEQPNAEVVPEDEIDESMLNSDQLPDWLVKVRERAQVEEDAVGDLASGTIAMDAVRSEEASAGVEGEFNAWINRIREKSQQENNVRARQLPSETDDSEQVPEWLQRIRALRPRPEEEITHEVKTAAAYPDDMPREWTDEALEELRRQALAEDQEQDTEPLPTASIGTEEDELPAEAQTEELGESAQEEPEPVKDGFHNIPDDEDAYSEGIPEKDLTQLPELEEETLVEQAREEEPESGQTQAPGEEPELQGKGIQEVPVQDLTPQEEPQAEEPVGEELALEPESSEPHEQAEPESISSEGQAESTDEEQEEEPEELDQPSDSGAVPPDLLLLRDQQDRASLLASLIEQEGRVTAGKQAIRKPSGRAGRLAVALLLLIGLIVSIIIGPSTIPTNTPKSIPALALSDQIQTLAENDRVLVVLDYQSATSRELEALAAPVLDQLHTLGTQIDFLTTQPSGLFLAQSLLAQAGLPADTQVDYLPGSYLSLLSSAVNPAISTIGNDLLKDLHSFKLVLLVSDSSDNIRGWLEQIAPWVETLKFAAVTTQMEAPVLSPYFDSGQLVGYDAGVSNGNIYPNTTFNYRAYQVGLLLMLVMLLLGMISKGEEDAIRREEERAE
jgi:hypothetical protein